MQCEQLATESICGTLAAGVGARLKATRSKKVTQVRPSVWEVSAASMVGCSEKSLGENAAKNSGGEFSACLDVHIDARLAERNECLPPRCFT